MKKKAWSQVADMLSGFFLNYPFVPSGSQVSSFQAGITRAVTVSPEDRILPAEGRGIWGVKGGDILPD